MKKILTIVLIGIAGMVNADTWIQKANYGGTSRHGSGGFSIGNKGYVGGGIIDCPQIFLNDFWEYHSSTNAWTQRANYPDTLGFYNGISFSIDSFGYMGLSTSFSHFYQYDPVNNLWSNKASYPGNASEANIAFSIGNKGYVGLGGYWLIQTAEKDFWEYDPATDIWTRKADFGGSWRINACGFSIGNNGYVCGGESIDTGQFASNYT